MDCVAIFQIVKDIAVASAAVTTSAIAIMGLKSWKRELKGKTEFEVARALILSTYKLRDELKYARSPWVSGHEFPDDYPQNPSIRTPQIEAEAYAFVYGNRWKPVSVALQEFEAQALEGEALWGVSNKTKTQELRQCVRNLQVSIEAFINDKATGGENFRADRVFGQSVKADVWGTENDNVLTDKINASIAAIEKEIRPHLQRS
ncbi:hypothetical protein [Vibrio barjaei]|uniref:hypothetical protein n=1 Tax=Vibrio barjaei TaxID=1676683 RepID=UPI0007BBA645|nr:hypothetical protein [Vibrio barjaei]OIN27962.1 hypothetical protein AWH66_2011475 [Vibrio barjaei]